MGARTTAQLRARCSVLGARCSGLGARGLGLGRRHLQPGGVVLRYLEARDEGRWCVKTCAALPPVSLSH